MAITHTFKGSKGGGRYGYYAYIEDGLLVIGEDWPREGGTIYKGTYKDAGSTMMLLKKEAPKLYKSIVDYYTENPEVEVIDSTVWVENKLKAAFQQLEVEYRFKADNAYVSAIRANSTNECETFSAEYELNRKLSETYRMMALRAGEYAKQFSGV
jgi:hypothetical protein